MNRLAALVLTVVLQVGSGSASPAAAAAASTTLAVQSAALQADANATNVTPGQRLAGVIGAGQEEFECAVEQRHRSRVRPRGLERLAGRCPEGAPRDYP